MDPHIHGILINFLNVDSLISYILPENLLSFVFNNLFSRRLLIYTKGHIQGYKLKNSYFSFHSLWKKKKKNQRREIICFLYLFFPSYIQKYIEDDIFFSLSFLFPLPWYFLFSSLSLEDIAQFHLHAKIYVYFSIKNYFFYFT